MVDGKVPCPSVEHTLADRHLTYWLVILQTDRQTGLVTYCKAGWRTDSLTDRLANTQTGHQTDWPIDRVADRRIDQQADWPTHRLANRRTDRQVDSSTDRLPNRQTVQQTYCPTVKQSKQIDWLSDWPTDICPTEWPTTLTDIHSTITVLRWDRYDPSTWPTVNLSTSLGIYSLFVSAKLFSTKRRGKNENWPTEERENIVLTFTNFLTPILSIKPFFFVSIIQLQ